MTTDNQTNEPTPEQVKAAAKAAYEFDADVSELFGRGFTRDFDGMPQWAKDTHLDKARAALEAAARAAQGAGVASQEPTLSNSEILERIAEQEREAAGAPAPQEPNQNETKSGNNFVSLDPEKVGAIIDYYHDIPYGRRELIIDALCEAYTEGRLS